MSPALTHAFSSPSHLFQLTNAPPMTAFAAITTLGSPLAAIRSTIQATRAHQRPISPRPNYSSIPPSVPLGSHFWASTLPISTSKPPCNTEYMHLCLNIIPNEIIVHYNLWDIVIHSWRLGIYWDSKGDVCSSPSWHPQKSTTWRTPCHQSLVGKFAQISAKLRNYSNSGPFELQNFHWNFIFPIVIFFSANSEHVSSGSESSPAIDSSNFINQKMFLPSLFFWPAKEISTSCISLLVDLTMLNFVDVGTIPGKAIFLTIIQHLLKLGWCEFFRQNNHAAKITSTHFE